MEVWMLSFVGIFLGCLCRLLLPYLRKLKENPNLKFDWKYLITFAISLVSAFVASALIFPSFSIPEGAEYQIFFLSFIAGWSSTDILSEIVATGEHR